MTPGENRGLPVTATPLVTNNPCDQRNPTIHQGEQTLSSTRSHPSGHNGASNRAAGNRSVGNRSVGRAALLLVLACAVAAAIIALATIAGRALPFVSLAGLQAHRHWLSAYAAAHPLLAPLAFFCLYIGFVAIPAPGAGILTIAAGAVFGLGEGIALVSFASSLGATLAFLLSRSVLHEPVRRRFGPRLQTLSRGVEAEGAFYLFALRLMPVAPFFLVNLLMGLTRLPVFTFYWVSQIGMLPATIVYVNAGLRLAEVHSLSGLVSAPILASFAALGLLPLISRRLVQAARRLRAAPLPQR